MTAKERGVQTEQLSQSEVSKIALGLSTQVIDTLGKTPEWLQALHKETTVNNGSMFSPNSHVFSLGSRTYQIKIKDERYVTYGRKEFPNCRRTIKVEVVDTAEDRPTGKNIESFFLESAYSRSKDFLNFEHPNGEIISYDSGEISYFGSLSTPEDEQNDRSTVEKIKKAFPEFFAPSPRSDQSVEVTEPVQGNPQL